MDTHQESGCRHVWSAMVLNTRRGFRYAIKSKGGSLWVSIPLVLSEWSALLAFSFFDLWGMKYNRRGIDIIIGDFVPMAKVNSADTPLRHSGVASAQEHKTLKTRLRTYIAELKVLNRAGNLAEIVEITHRFLQEILALENKTESLFPMHRHVVESIGVAALNSMTYYVQSNGATKSLSKWFIAFQIVALYPCSAHDRNAQKSHRLGIGIIENDVPYIPFLEAYAERNS
jgi:hypothetical protein